MPTVGKAGEIAAGRMTRVEVEGASVAIANVGNAFYAFSDTCTHRGCSLSEGELAGLIVTCPCHGGQFDISSGSVVGGPPGESIETFPVEAEAGDLKIG